MVVAKRQRKGKAHKNGTKENLRTRVRTSGETKPSWLAQFTWGRLRGRRQTDERRKPRPLRPLLLGRPTLTP